MRPAPAIEALAGLLFNGVAFAADMAMFDFGPQRPKLIAHGPRKGGTVLVGSHGLHVQCSWQLRRGSEIIASDRGALMPEAVGSAAGLVVDSAAHAAGAIAIELGAFKLDIIPDAVDDEQWRLLIYDPERDHLVWGGDYGAQG